MKTVFPNRQVAHIWAQQNQSHGKSGNGNFHFQDTVIYSYRTPIANFVKGKDKQPVVLVTSAKYSVTTSCKHMPSVWRAIGQYRNFHVPFIGVTGVYNKTDSAIEKEMHQGNFDYLVQNYRDNFASELRARSYYEINPKGRLADTLDTLKTYIAVFGLKKSIPVKLGEWPSFNPEMDGNYIASKREQRENKSNDPVYRAKLEKEKIKRVERKERKEAFARDYSEGEYINNLLSWREGKNIYLGYRGYGVGAALRIKGDNIETSQGAEFPISHAIKVFEFIRSRKELGQEWNTNGHSIHLGNFKIDKIDMHGNVKAGCHYVEWHEIETIAVQLKIYP